MRHFVIAAAMLLACGASFAQVYAPQMNTSQHASPSPDSTAAPAPPGEGAAEAAIGGAGVPLGTTELFAGGLSPAPTDATVGPTCPGAGPIPGVGALGTGSIFASNGTLATSASDIAATASTTDTGCGLAASAGVGPLGLSSSLGTNFLFAGGNVAVGATALGTSGLAGTVALPVPGSPSSCGTPGGLLTTAQGVPNLGLGSVPVAGMPSSTPC